MKVFATLSMTLPLLAAVASASAAWFAEDGSYSRRREEKVAVLAPARFDALRKLIAERDARQTEVVVLSRLAAEKTAAVAEMDKRFAGEYGIRADRNYTYDPSDLTVYLLSTDARHGGSPESPIRLAHRVFPTDEEAQAFFALMQTKQAALDARAVFLSAAAEKENALRDVVSRMGRDYNLDPVRSYRLDPDMRAIFAQYVPPPQPREKTPEEIAAEKDAKAAAERQVRENALARAEALRAEAKRIAEEKSRLSADQKESLKVREESLRQVEKELAELDAREAKLKKEAEKRKAEEDRRKARAEELAKKEAERKAREEAEAQAKAEREKARAEERAKKEAERKALEEAEAKAKADRERARAEEMAKKEADKEAAEKARLDAIRAEETALTERIAQMTRERTLLFNAAQTALETAKASREKDEKKLETLRNRLKQAKKDDNLPPARIDSLKIGIEIAEENLARSRRVFKEAAAAADKATRSLDHAEKDATEAFDAEIRANGGKPVRPGASGGFFSWF